MSQRRQGFYKLPKASSITEDHLEAALSGSTHQQKRITLYGKLNRRILKNIGKPALKDGTVGKL